jgi:hypothetical protein
MTDDMAERFDSYLRDRFRDATIEIVASFEGRFVYRVRCSYHGTVAASTDFAVVEAAKAEHSIEHDPDRAPDGRLSFTCPVCGRTSRHPDDVREGYCGACHAWTGEDGGGEETRTP